MDLFSCCTLPYTVAGIAACAVVMLVLRPRRQSVRGRHFVITGGSSGIGKALAILVVREGGHVTLLARNKAKLEAAAEEVKAEAVEGSQVRVAPVDVASAGEKGVAEALRAASDDLGPAFMLVNSAGISLAATFEDTPADQFERLMSVNYVGSVNATRALLPAMKANNDGGSIVFVSSQAGLLGLYGYSAYSASKFALRGLAESLSMELKPWKISVTLSFPPDTDTPGFALENQGKPEETKLISETAGLFQPEAVAAGILEDSLRGRFYSSPGLDGWMLTTISAGMSDSWVLDLIKEILLMGPLRLVGFCYKLYFHYIVAQCHRKKQKQK